MYREQLAEELAEKRIQILVESKQTRNDKSESVTDEEDEWVSSVLLHQEKVKVEVYVTIGMNLIFMDFIDDNSGKSLTN